MLLAPVKPLELLQALSEMAPSFERVKPGLSRALLSEAIGVAGWLDPSLRKIHGSMCSG